MDSSEQVFSGAPSLRESPKAVTEADLDHMHHALGRPDGPWVKPYRNYFATDADSPDAARFRELGLWSEGGSWPGGLTSFKVTPEGIAAVWKWLDQRNDRKGLRAYRVTSPVNGFSPQTVIAKSPSAARYGVYLSSDWFADGFGDFLATYRLSARLVSARKDGASPQ